MKKTLYAVFGLMSLALVGTVALIVTQQASSNRLAATDPEYTITLDDSNVAPELGDTYDREILSEAIYEKGDYILNMSYRLAKATSGNHVTLAPHGSMYNEIDNSLDYENRITGLNYITVNYTSTSSVSIRTSIREDGREYSAPVTATSGTPVVFDHSPYYFMIEAGDAEADIESVVLGYSCQESTGISLYSLVGRYSGLGDDTYRYVLDIASNGGVTVKSLDNPSNVQFSGTATMSGAAQVQCTFDVGGNPGVYTSNVSADLRTLSFVSKTGAAAVFPQITFYKVYNVEDFESYTMQGQGFGGKVNEVQRTADSLYDMTGLRAAYHADWWSTNSLPVSYLGDSGWKVMGSSDFLSYSATGGVNSSKTGIFKGNTNGLRYMQFKGVQGLPNIIGKGSYLSFYAKACTNTSLNTLKSTDTTIKVNAYYVKQITKSNVNDDSSSRTSTLVTIPANTGWARYTVPLNSAKSYYSFGIYDNKGSQVYLAIDNVEIYTVDPHEPVAATGVSVSPSVLNLETGNNGQLTATVSPVDATNKGVVWTSNNESVATVNNNGLVTAYNAGNATITATTVDGGFTATCAVTVTGASVAPYPSGSYKGTAVVQSANFDIVIAFGTRANGLIAVRLSNKDAVATGVTYDDATQNFTIATTGNYSSLTYGNITGHYDDANNKLTNIACSGTISSYVSSISDATTLTVWDCDGTTSELQSLFKRRYMSGSWQVDASNADRITSNTTEFVSGTGSVKRRGYSGGAVALNFNSDFSPAKSVHNIQYWVYNPSASDIVLRMWVYKATNFNSNAEQGSVTAKAGQWTYVAMGMSDGSNPLTSPIYNIQIADFNNTGVYLSFDNIALF